MPGNILMVSDSFSSIWKNNIKKKAPCAEAVTYYDEALTTNPDLTFGEAIAMIPEYFGAERVDHAWAVWVLANFWNSLDTLVRQAFIRKIKQKRFLMFIKEEMPCNRVELSLIKSELESLTVG